MTAHLFWKLLFLQDTRNNKKFYTTCWKYICFKSKNRTTWMMISVLLDIVGSFDDFYILYILIILLHRYFSVKYFSDKNIFSKLKKYFMNDWKILQFVCHSLLQCNEVMKMQFPKKLNMKIWNQVFTVDDEYCQE